LHRKIKGFQWPGLDFESFEARVMRKMRREDLFEESFVEKWKRLWREKREENNCI